jgi:hypothetical protein
MVVGIWDLAAGHAGGSGGFYLNPLVIVLVTMTSMGGDAYLMNHMIQECGLNN